VTAVGVIADVAIGGLSGDERADGIGESGAHGGVAGVLAGGGGGEKPLPPELGLPGRALGAPAKRRDQVLRILREDAIADASINLDAQISAELNVVEGRERKRIRHRVPRPSVRQRSIAPGARATGQRREQREPAAAGELRRIAGHHW
jgi:hypothetical protein